jgi:hypothetical protein
VDERYQSGGLEFDEKTADISDGDVEQYTI